MPLYTSQDQGHVVHSVAMDVTEILTTNARHIRVWTHTILSSPPPPTPQVPVQGRQPGSDKPVTIPDSLVAVQAFIMWEEAGKPQVRDTCEM
jgi:hypothetical protein